jgi:hypothetical protein
MNVWRMAAGEPGRDYRSVFFEHDVMFLAPSHLGPAADGRYKYVEKICWLDGVDMYLFSNC